MSAIDTAKDIIRIGTTAGLSKDVIDLLEKKCALLVEENTALSTQVSSLEIENGQLRRQLEDFQPVDKPGDECPYCQRTTGELTDLKPHKYFFPQGWKVGYYKC